MDYIEAYVWILPALLAFLDPAAGLLAAGALFADPKVGGAALTAAFTSDIACALFPRSTDRPLLLAMVPDTIDWSERCPTVALVFLLRLFNIERRRHACSFLHRSPVAWCAGGLAGAGLFFGLGRLSGAPLNALFAGADRFGLVLLIGITVPVVRVVALRMIYRLGKGL